MLLSRAAAAEMFPPEHRARGMSFVLFGAVSGAIFGPLVFGPIFADRALTPQELAWPWLASSLFAAGGLLISLARAAGSQGAVGRLRVEAAPAAPPRRWARSSRGRACRPRWAPPSRASP